MFQPWSAITSLYDWLLCCVSAMVSYNVIIGDTITKIIFWMGGDSKYIAL